MATPTQHQSEMHKTRKAYPQRKRWDYIATPEESAELEKLRAIRKAIAQSQAEFEKGEYLPATPEFFAEIKQLAKKRHFATSR